MVIPKLGEINAYAMIVDINQFVPMVSVAEQTGDIIAQFTRDTLGLLIQAIETDGGEVVGFMGDAFYAVFPEGDKIVKACFGAAKMIDRQCEFISDGQRECEHLWAFAKGGPSVKIAIEYGTLDVSTIYGRLLGEQPLLVGSAVNYAARISVFGKGNRCLVGPVAAKMAFGAYRLDGPFSIKGKRGEPTYECYRFDMGETWIEGPRRRGKDTYWG